MSLDFLLKSFSEEDLKPQAKLPKDEISLTGALQRKRLALGRQKEPRERAMTFSPYSVGYGFCMREKVAQLAMDRKILEKPPTPKEQLTFDVGHKFHDILQGYFWKCGMLEGSWRCLICGDEFWARSPKKCPQCDREDLEFREVPLQNEELHISGRADGIIWLEVAKDVEARHLVDIKSISSRGKSDTSQGPRLCFEDLESEGPAVTHQVQLHCYMMMSGIHDGHLLYVEKNGPHRMKSFHIKYNEVLLRPYLDDIKKAILWANDLRNGFRRDLPATCSAKKCECEEIVYTSQGNEPHSSALTGSTD